MLLIITHIDILFKIQTNKLITRNYNTLVLIGSLVGLFNMYHKSANKYRDQKDQQFREARATFESALKQINKDDTDFNEFYDLLKYTKTTVEYYQLDQLINDKNKVTIR